MTDNGNTGSGKTDGSRKGIQIDYVKPYGVIAIGIIIVLAAAVVIFSM